MANKIYPFTIPSNYTYDDTKIEVVDGKAKLKVQTNPNIYAHYHLNEATGETVIDSSGNGRSGIPANSPISVAGKLNNSLSFNGSSQYINCGNIAKFERTDSFSIEYWLKTTSTRQEMIISTITDSPHTGYQVHMTAGKIILWLCNNSTGNYLMITTINAVNDNLFHHIIITYDGSSSSTGVNIYIDNVLQALSVIQNNLTATILNSNNFTIAQKPSTPSNQYFTGLIDEVVIYDKELAQEEVTERWNNGSGTENLLNSGYPTDKPTIKSTTSWEISGLSQFTAFVEILGGGNQGSVVYQLSDDEGVNWRYWNGSSWAITDDQYNDISTVHTNIGSFPVSNEKIMFRAFLISDGLQQCELDTLEFTILVGDPPVVYAGADKICYDHETIKLFSDATISDPDGDIEQASVWYNIEGSGWIHILKGEYGTLQEAVRNFQYTFDNIGVINYQLKVIDQTSKETIDDLNMTVQKYTVTFNVKDKDGNYLANFQFLPDDGSDWQTLNSPFTWDYVWKSGDYKVIFDKVGFQTAKADVEVSVHIENITMTVLGAVSPEEVADAVWDELRSGHVIVNSFGDTNQKKVPSENINDYKADVSDLNGIKINTDKIQDIKTETDKLDSIRTETDKIPDVKIETDKMDSVKTETNKIQSIKSKTDNIPTDPTSETNAIINKNETEVKIDNSETLIRRVLGLVQENFRIFSPVFDENGNLLSSTVKIYSSKGDCDTDVNSIAIYNLVATYTNGLLATYKVTKE